MGTIYLGLSAPSGGSYAATIERLSDGYYRQDDAEVFSSGLSFGDKDVSLTEGSSENRGTYSTTLTATNWNDGIYRLRVHNKDVPNRVDSVADFGVVDGSEVTVGEATFGPVYHADIQFIKDATNSQDEYRTRWFKNGVRVITGITNPALSVITPSGTYLVDNKAMTSVGQGAYKYTASTVAERQTAGEHYEVVTSGTIDSSTRTFSWILSRDSE